MSARARTWTALIVPPIAWFLFEQGLSALLHIACGQVMAGLIWGAASLIACAVAFRLAWPLRTHADTLADPWLARLALIGAGIFSLAILFQSLAILMVPSCVR